MTKKDNNSLQKLKRAVIKEELVALTGDYKKAITLNQMIYWAERVKDFDKFLADEKVRARMAMGRAEVEYAEKLEEIDLMSHGWIYKSAEELSEETMMGVSKSTMGTYLKTLVEKGWLDKRKNPKWKGDNTFQYRVNLLKIQQDLYNLGYSLEGYPLLISEFENTTPKFENQTSVNQATSGNQTTFENQTMSENQTTSSEILLPSSILEHGSSKIKQPVRESNNQFENQTTLPEITTEITTETTLEKNLNLNQEIDIWNLKLPMSLKRYFKDKVSVLVKDSFDIYIVEEFYNVNSLGYIEPDCSSEDYEHVNDSEFSLIVKKIFETVNRPIRTTHGIIKDWVLRYMSFKRDAVFESPEVVQSKHPFLWNWLDEDSESNSGFVSNPNILSESYDESYDVLR